MWWTVTIRGGNILIQYFQDVHWDKSAIMGSLQQLSYNHKFQTRKLTFLSCLEMISTAEPSSFSARVRAALARSAETPSFLEILHAALSVLPSTTTFLFSVTSSSVPPSSEISMTSFRLLAPLALSELAALASARSMSCLISRSVAVEQGSWKFQGKMGFQTYCQTLLRVNMAWVPQYVLRTYDSFEPMDHLIPRQKMWLLMNQDTNSDRSETEL